MKVTALQASSGVLGASKSITAEMTIRAQVSSGSKFRSGVLEVCKHRLREFPHVETFVRERSESYPNIKVKYYFGSPPRLNLKSGSSSESIRIDHWKTEHIEEYLKDKLLSAT
ncbi:MAG: hypothetical protein FRX49_07232 [Trebouxia sp. A1-2]|nr:MAG: hypothetical protein FRX49_07232 [Trebouxia sp. A1-2]